MSTLFDPIKLGDLTLPNRIWMAPLTRMRSQQPGNVPYALNAEYYAQRASAGLIISEATQISPLGQGYPGTPGIHSAEQIDGWKLVTEAVHQKGGKIFLQLWHVGRISHSSHHPKEGLPVAPSAVKPLGMTLSNNWIPLPYETPRALELKEIPGIISEYNKAAENAKTAGFDGVEIHSANGYLLDQFLQDETNRRTDEYGGSIQNRARLLMEVVDAVAQVWPKSRIGVRLSPYGTFNSIKDSAPMELFPYVIEELSKRGIAYVHLIEPRVTDAGMWDTVNKKAPCTSEIFRKYFKGLFISAGGYDYESAAEALEAGRADAIAFGRLFISNPDLPERFQRKLSLNKYNRVTFYGGNEKGYTDYPAMH